MVASIFLSTLSLRRATTRQCLRLSFFRHFYPRSPCGERPNPPDVVASCTYFYPRSPCGERRAVYNKSMLLHLFLSTLSLRRATLGAGKSCDVCGISIHALLAESDRQNNLNHSHRRDFYPRSPCGERQLDRTSPLTSWAFLSTLSLRRATPEPETTPSE